MSALNVPVRVWDPAAAPQSLTFPAAGQLGPASNKLGELREGEEYRLSL